MLTLSVQGGKKIFIKQNKLSEKNEIKNKIIELKSLIPHSGLMMEKLIMLIQFPHP